MFNLTSKKYLFFGLSLLVIIPGLLALIVWHLNPGIDFTNGATIDMRFAGSSVTTQGIAQVFTAPPASARDVQVFSSTSLSGATPASQYAYIKFSRPIGVAEKTSILGTLQDPKNKLPAIDTTNVHTFYTITLANAPKAPYAMMVVPFKSAVKADSIKSALANLPATDAPPPIDATPTPAPTPNPTTLASPTAAPTATASSATPTATATPTPATAPTFPVSVADVQLGANGNTYTVETQTFLEGPRLDAIVAQLQQKYGYGYIADSTQVGPAIASETTVNAILAVVAASVFILIYISIAFRKVGSIRQASRYGACAIIALLHDALVVLGLWAIFGHFFDFKVDTLFVTAVLTVIGFSVHDTIVVFDRIRENLQRRTTETFDQVVNASLVQTMSRSLNTSLTVLFTLSALTLFGGQSIRTFTLALLIGIASGTYSSIFNASMLLVVWETGEWRRWFGRRSKPRAQQAAAYRKSLARAGAR